MIKEMCFQLYSPTRHASWQLGTGNPTFHHTALATMTTCAVYDTCAEVPNDEWVSLRGAGAVMNVSVITWTTPILLTDDYLR